jgi:hypothetical protein
MTGPDHHAEMEAHCAAARERQDDEHIREITSWLADQMCRTEEPLIGQFANSLSVEGAKRLNALMTEGARLRKALADIEEGIILVFDESEEREVQVWMDPEDMQEIARQALAGAPQGMEARSAETLGSARQGDSLSA